MGTPPIQRLLGLKVIGDTREGNGSGFQAIGRDAQGPMPIGFRAVGKKEGEVGSGLKGVGSIVKLKVKSLEFRV
jgi:hypothetical protein